MSDLTPSTQSLSLFQIESELRELMDFRDTEELTAEERQVIEQQIQEYTQRSVAKVDPIRGAIRWMENKIAEADEERKRATKYRDSWQARLDYLKDCTKAAMQVLDKKRLDGKAGYLRVQPSGGKQALTVYDEALIPRELTYYSGAIDYEEWQKLMNRAMLPFDWLPYASASDKHLYWRRVPDNEAVRAELEKPCEKCGGLGTQCPAGPSDAPLETCTGCDGSGKTLVPGARLEPRGVSLIVK